MLDEPSAGLNRDEREDLARFILRIKHELGIAMIWIEHDMQMVADLADRIHVLDYGRTLAEGAPARGAEGPARDRGLYRDRGVYVLGLTYATRLSMARMTASPCTGPIATTRLRPPRFAA